MVTVYLGGDKKKQVTCTMALLYIYAWSDGKLKYCQPQLLYCFMKNFGIAFSWVLENFP